MIWHRFKLMARYAGVLLVVACGLAWLLLPAAQAPAALPADKSVIDIHVHVAGLGNGCAGCFVGDALLSSYKFGWYLRAFGTSEAEITDRGDAVIVERILEMVAESRWVSQVVILALDGVVNNTGLLDRERTQVYVANSYVARLAREHEEILFGASINPHHVDALARLDQAVADGAVLVKWIPAIMDIDPADPALDAFYARLAQHQLPLLVHVGDENAFAHADNTLGDPWRLRRPLEAGVKVIAAHIGTTGTNDGTPNFDRLLPMFDEFPNLYSEISSLTQVNKLGYLVRAAGRSGLRGRLLHGSDWPLQFFPLVWAGWHTGRAPLAELRYAAGLNNPLDRDIALKSALGMPPSVFTFAGSFLQVATKR